MAVGISAGLATSAAPAASCEIALALAIDVSDEDLSGYYWENVIAGPSAFVVTANGFEDYAKRIKLKLLRELTAQVSMLSAPPADLQPKR